MPGNGASTRKQLWHPPIWMDAAFVEAVLQVEREGDTEGERRATRVEHVKIEPATAVGDHYLSRIFRVTATVRGRSSPVALIVKCLPENEVQLKWIREKKCFLNELHMYRQVLPAMEELLQAAEIPQKFTARFFPNASDDIVTLEDLSTQGFVMRDRFRGMDFDHAAATLRALARLHAASAALVERSPHLARPLSCIFDTPNDTDIYIKLMKKVVAITKFWEDFPQELIEKLEAASEGVPDIARELCRKNEERFTVINHGDVWTNNLMFRHENGQIECRFLDLQFCFVGSPAMDLITFQVTSLTPDVWHHRWDELVAEYSSSLAGAARLLGVARAPSLEDLRAELRRARQWTLVAAVTWMPVILVERGCPFDFEALLQQDDAVAASAVSEAFENRLRVLLSYCSEIGVFEDEPPHAERAGRSRLI